MLEKLIEESNLSHKKTPGFIPGYNQLTKPF